MVKALEPLLMVAKSAIVLSNGVRANIREATPGSPVINFWSRTEGSKHDDYGRETSPAHRVVDVSVDSSTVC